MSQTKSEVIKVGQFVEVLGKCWGTVKYIGSLDFSGTNQTFYGIDLDLPSGKHDGYLHGHRYFTAKKDHGIFVPRTKIKSKPSSPSLSQNSSPTRTKKKRAWRSRSEDLTFSSEAAVQIPAQSHPKLKARTKAFADMSRKNREKRRSSSETRDVPALRGPSRKSRKIQRAQTMPDTKSFVKAATTSKFSNAPASKSLSLSPRNRKHVGVQTPRSPRNETKSVSRKKDPSLSRSKRSEKAGDVREWMKDAFKVNMPAANSVESNRPRKRDPTLRDKRKKNGHKVKKLKESEKEGLNSAIHLIFKTTINGMRLEEIYPLLDRETKKVLSKAIPDQRIQILETAKKQFADKIEYNKDTQEDFWLKEVDSRVKEKLESVKSEHGKETQELVKKLEEKRTEMVELESRFQLQIKQKAEECESLQLQLKQKGEECDFLQLQLNQKEEECDSFQRQLTQNKKERESIRVSIREKEAFWNEREEELVKQFGTDSRDSVRDEFSNAMRIDIIQQELEEARQECRKFEKLYTAEHKKLKRHVEKRNKFQTEWLEKSDAFKKLLAEETKQFGKVLKSNKEEHLQDVATIQSLNKEIHRLRQQLEKQVSETAQTQSANQHRALQSSHIIHVSDEDEKEESSETLASRNFEEELAEKNLAIERLEMQVQELQESSDNALRQLSEQIETKEIIETDLQELQKACDDAFRQLAEEVEAKESLRSEIQTLQQASDDALRQLSEQVEAKQALETEIEELQQACDNAFQQLSEQVEAKEAIESELKDLHEASALTLIQLSDQVEAKEALENELQELQQSSALTLIQLAEQVDVKEDLENQLQELEEMIDQPSDNASELLSEEMQEKDDEIELLELKLRESQESCQESDRKLQHQVEEMEALQSRFDELKSLIDQRESEISESRLLETKHQEIISSLLDQVSQLKQKQQSQKKTQKEISKKHMRDIASLQREVEDLERELEDKDKDHGKELSDMEALFKQKIEALEQKSATETKLLNATISEIEHLKQREELKAAPVPVFISNAVISELVDVDAPLKRSQSLDKLELSHVHEAKAPSEDECGSPHLIKMEDTLLMSTLHCLLNSELFVERLESSSGTFTDDMKRLCSEENPHERITICQRMEHFVGDCHVHNMK